MIHKMNTLNKNNNDRNRNMGSHIARLLLAAGIIAVLFAISTMAANAAVVIQKQIENGANFGSDNTCGRIASHLNEWCNACNSGSFICSGPGACWNDNYQNPGGCYFWQPNGNPKVRADTQVYVPNSGIANFYVVSMNYGGGTYANERVNVFVNGNFIGTTTDHACNLGSDCFSEESCTHCNVFGPFEDSRSGVSFNQGWNTVTFEAVENGGSVSIDRYTVELVNFCGNGVIEDGEQCDDGNNNNN